MNFSSAFPSKIFKQQFKKVSGLANQHHYFQQRQCYLFYIMSIFPLKKQNIFTMSVTIKTFCIMLYHYLFGLLALSESQLLQLYSVTFIMTSYTHLSNQCTWHFSSCITNTKHDSSWCTVCLHTDNPPAGILSVHRDNLQHILHFKAVHLDNTGRTC